MGERDEETGLAFESEIAFRRTLSTLKQQGSALLVVGAVPDSVHTDACRQMLGDSSNRPRRRLFVETDAVCDAAATRFSLEDPFPVTNTAHRITHPAYARGVDVASPGAARIPTTRLEDTDLGSLGATISETIAEFDDLADSLDPAELRLCFDSLTPMVEGHDPDVAFRFLHLLTARVREVRGQAHFHLPVDHDDPIVDLLAPLFDAVVELSVEDGAGRQRWHFREDDVTTEWLAFDDHHAGSNP